MSAKKYLFITLFVVIASTFTWGDWEDRKGPPPLVYLSDLLENPESWLDVPVRIPLRFSGIRQIYTPFFTRFDRDTFLNFSAWDVHTPVWEKEGFLDDYPFFYVDKMEKEFKAFLELQKFDTIAVMGKVSSIFDGKPYFKIVWVCKQDGDLSIHNLTLLNRGTRAYKEGRFDESINYFSQVFKTNPPEDIKAMMHKSMAQVYLYEKKNYQTALEQLRRGLKITKNDMEMREMYSQCEYHLKHGGPEPRPIIVQAEETPEVKQEIPNSLNSSYTTNNSSSYATNVEDDSTYVENNTADDYGFAEVTTDGTEDASEATATETKTATVKDDASSEEVVDEFADYYGEENSTDEFLEGYSGEDSASEDEFSEDTYVDGDAEDRN